MTLHANLTGANLHAARSLSGTGIPVGSVTPTIIGELYLDTTAGSETLYVSTGLTTTDWVSTGGGGGSTSRAFTVVVAKSGGAFTTVQAAIDSITVGAGEKYIVLIYPGVFAENVTLKNGVSLRGMGTVGDVIIESSSGTTLTSGAFPAISFVSNLTIRCNATTTTPKAAICTGALSQFTGVSFDVNVTGSYVTAIQLSSGQAVFNDCNFRYDQTGLGGGIHAVVSCSSTASFSIAGGHTTMDVAAITAADHLHFIEDSSTTEPNSCLGLSADIEASSASFASEVDFWKAFTGTIHNNSQSNQVRIHTPSGAAGSIGHAYHIDSSGAAGRIHSTANQFIIEGFDSNYFAELDDATDELVSHFDDITADAGVAGPGTYTYVNSPADGDLTLSGIVVPIVLNQSADYGAAENYKFNIMLMDTSGGSRTVTFPIPAVMVNFKSGQTITIFNVNDDENLVYVDPNGNTVDGDLRTLAIRPNGYVTFQKVGNNIRIINSHLTSIYVQVSDIANSSFHADFSDASSVVTTGSLIDSITESVNSWVGTPDYNKPTYLLADQNGLNVAEWSSTNAPLTFGDKEIHDNTVGRGMHIFIVCNPTTSGDSIFSKYFDGTPQRAWDFQTARTYIYENADASGPEATANSASTYGEWQVLELRWVPGGTSKLYNNGFLRIASANAVTDIPATTSDLRIGARDLNSYDFTGKVGEIVAYSDGLTDVDRLALVASLGAKWGIDVATAVTASEPISVDDLEDVVAASPGPGAKLFFNANISEWADEPLPILAFGEMICEDTIFTWEELYARGPMLFVNTSVTLDGFVGNATVAIINGLTPTVNDSYLVTDAGTLAAGALAVVAGDIVLYNGAVWIMVAVNIGGFGRTGLRVQLSTTTALIAPYTDGTDDGKIAWFDGTSNTGTFTNLDVEVTLPDPALLAYDDGLLHRLYMGNLGGSGGHVHVKIVGGGTFIDGLEQLELEHNGASVMLGTTRGKLAAKWFRISNLRDNIQLRRSASWAATNFSSPAGIPFDTEDIDGNPYITSWASIPNPTRVEIEFTSWYTVSGFVDFDSTGGSPWSCAAYLRKNGTNVIPGTSLAPGNYNNEDSCATLPPFSIFLESGDYLEYVLSHTNLTGNLRAAVLLISCKH